jgi:hypothetical protein
VDADSVLSIEESHVVDREPTNRAELWTVVTDFLNNEGEVVDLHSLYPTWHCVGAQ